MNKLYHFLAYGYLPKELPPIFFSTKFAEKIKESHSDLSTIIKSKWSKPSKYLLQQRVRYKRPTSILNPSAFIRIADIISQNYTEISDSMDKSLLSVSKPNFKRKTKFHRAVSSEFIGTRVKEKKLLLRASYPIILKCDVKNFYKSIYTHSIPWAIHGKQYSKNHIHSNNAGNQIDKAIRFGQDGQTIGIPVGPDTSFVIGELLLSAIDKELGFDHSKAIRFYDDFEFGCKSKIEAESIIETLETKLSQFELELNHDKTNILKGPNTIESPWRQLLKDYTERKSIKRSEDYIDLFNTASSLAKTNPSDFVFKYFIRSMRRQVIPKKHWGTWQNILFAIAFSDFGNLRAIYEQLELYQKIGYKINKKALRNLLEIKAKNEFKGNISSELSWVLFGLYKFEIKPPKGLIGKVLQNGDDISRILAIKIARNRKIGIKKKIYDFTSYLGDGAAREKHWLLLWELYVNGWMRNDDLKNQLLTENIFEFLDEHKISFVRDTNIDLFDIPHVFKKKIEETSGKPSLDKIIAQLETNFPDSISTKLDFDDLESDDEDGDELIY